MQSFNSNRAPRRKRPLVLLSFSCDALFLSDVPVHFLERSVLKTGLMFQVCTLLVGGLDENT